MADDTSGPESGGTSGRDIIPARPGPLKLNVASVFHNIGKGEQVAEQQARRGARVRRQTVEQDPTAPAARFLDAPGRLLHGSMNELGYARAKQYEFDTLARTGFQIVD